MTTTRARPHLGQSHPDYPCFAALAARMLDDQLCEAIGVADADPERFRLVNLYHRQAFISALSAEAVRRFDPQKVV